MFGGFTVSVYQDKAGADEMAVIIDHNKPPSCLCTEPRFGHWEPGNHESGATL
jgi:hypothetical protein